MIVCVTLNPCLDKTLVVPEWRAGDLVRGIVATWVPPASPQDWLDRDAWVSKHLLEIRQSLHPSAPRTGPPDLDVAALRRSAAELAGVLSVHHVHVWSLTHGQPLLTMHVEIDRDAEHDEVLHRMQGFLAERFGIHHATIQVECGPCARHNVIFCQKPQPSP